MIKKEDIRIYLDEHIPFKCINMPPGITCTQARPGTKDEQIVIYCETNGHILITKDKEFSKYDIPLILLEGKDKHIIREFPSRIFDFISALMQCESRKIFVVFKIVNEKNKEKILRESGKIFVVFEIVNKKNKKNILLIIIKCL